MANLTWKELLPIIPFSRIQEVFDKIENPDPSVKKMVILFDE